MCHHFHLYSKGAKKTKELFLTGFNFQTPAYTYISENVVLNQEWSIFKTYNREIENEDYFSKLV